MKNISEIIEKYSKIVSSESNYSIGGGLSDGKFASRRHEDANNDVSRLTKGKTAAMFKKCTGCEISFINEILYYAVPNMEWHHAGKLPKSYGGGMKKTYFLNAAEIVMVAENWDNLVERLEISKAEKRSENERIRAKEIVKQQFLQLNAKRVERVSAKPINFYLIDREMQGKYGWFSSIGKSYTLPEYFTGWVFESNDKLNEFLSM